MGDGSDDGGLAVGGVVEMWAAKSDSTATATQEGALGPEARCTCCGLDPMNAFASADSWADSCREFCAWLGREFCAWAKLLLLSLSLSVCRPIALSLCVPLS